MASSPALGVHKEQCRTGHRNTCLGTGERAHTPACCLASLCNSSVCAQDVSTRCTWRMVHSVVGLSLLPPIQVFVKHGVAVFRAHNTTTDNAPTERQCTAHSARFFEHGLRLRFSFHLCCFHDATSSVSTHYKEQLAKNNSFTTCWSQVRFLFHVYVNNVYFSFSISFEVFLYLLTNHNT